MTISIASAMAEGKATLSNSGIQESRLDAGLLLSHAIGRDRAFIIAHSDEVISQEELKKFREWIARRAAGEPLQYITEHQEFFKLDFEVNPAVLIPRPETELIVETVLELFSREPTFTFADLGTGSGCIAISILYELQSARAVAIDNSPAALGVARRNAERHGVADRIDTLQSDLFATVSATDVFDLIVSNPPYVSNEELKALQREVQREPRSALAGGADGLDVIRRLLSDAPRNLRRDGYLIFEFGINQDRMIRDLVDRDVWELIDIRKDLQQIPRAIILQKR